MMVLPCEIKAEAPTAKVRRNKNDKLWIVPEVLPPGFLHPKSKKTVLFLAAGHGCFIFAIQKARTGGSVYGVARGILLTN
jgi:hypothetical protein